MIEFNIRKILNIVVAVFFAVLAVKLFIWLLPIIIIVILANYIYKKIKNISFIKEDEEVESIKRTKTKNTSKTKNKKIIIIDEENND